ncbi:MAG: ABC transporter ATP-binding protein [Candidatus Bathyarchaeota archaeon]
MDPILETKNLTKRFGGLTAVKDVNIKVNQNEILGLIGPNGAGKTTFFNLITGFIKPDSGTVLFKGENITKLKPHKIANMGMTRTFQLVKPFKNMLAAENIALAYFSKRATQQNEDDVPKKVVEMLRRVEIIPPNENMFKLARNLSHGYSKRLDIARALVLEPDILLLDEPFGGLGLKETTVMASLIRKLHKEENLTIIIIEHKMRELMKLIDKVIVMHFGEKIAEGSPDEIKKNMKVCEAYLGKTGGSSFA